MVKINQIGSVQILVVLVLMIGLAVGTILVQNPTNLSSKAVSFTPTPSPVPPFDCNITSEVCFDRTAAEVTVKKNHGFKAGGPGYWTGEAFRLQGQGQKGFNLNLSGLPTGIEVTPSGGAFINNGYVEIRVAIALGSLPLGDYSGSISLTNTAPSHTIPINIHYIDDGTTDVYSEPAIIKVTQPYDKYDSYPKFILHVPMGGVIQVSTVAEGTNPGISALFLPERRNVIAMTTSSHEVGTFMGLGIPVASGTYKGYFKFEDTGGPREILRVPYEFTIVDGPHKDSDNDGWSDDQESFMGTKPYQACPNTPGGTISNDSAWPPDINNNRVVNILDFSTLNSWVNPATYNKPYVYNKRYDLNTDGKLNQADMDVFLANDLAGNKLYLGKICGSTNNATSANSSNAPQITAITPSKCRVLDNPYGSINWENPQLANINDSSPAVINLNSNTVSEYLFCDNLGLNIPSGKSITGIAVKVKRKASLSLMGKDTSILLAPGGKISGSDRSKGGLISNSFSEISVGGKTDQWGLNLSNAMVSDPKFGVAYAVKKTSLFNVKVEVDSIGVEVYY
jgi:hypothetical protein